MTAGYGLVNANAKWQAYIDSFLTSSGFNQLIYVPQLFYIKDSSGSLVTLAVKIVDAILFAGTKKDVSEVIHKIENNYKLGAVVYGPGTFLFYGLQITQDTDYSITVQSDEKLSKLEGYPVDRQRRKQIETSLNAAEMHYFRSVNSSIGWLGIAASPFCTFYASTLQQKLPSASVHDLISQINNIRVLKKLGSAVTFKRPKDEKQYRLSVLIFSDASRSTDHGQL